MSDVDAQGIRVLLADDDLSFVESLRELIDRQPELEVVGAVAPARTSFFRPRLDFAPAAR